jgi:hypothetical protein
MPPFLSEILRLPAAPSFLKPILLTWLPPISTLRQGGFMLASEKLSALD